MKYMGSKSRIATRILSIILRNRELDQWYVEPFCGGCNVIDKVKGKRIANDSNPYLIAMWKALVEEAWEPPYIDKILHNKIKNNKNDYGPELIGWVGFNCSFKGVFFGGFAGECKTKIGTIRNYQTEALANIEKQVQKLKNTDFRLSQFYELQFPKNSIVYCDPPYMNVHGYMDGVDFNQFWSWVRTKTEEGHQVYVSEYQAPSDFEFIWEVNIRCTLGVVSDRINTPGGTTYRTEKLFRYKNVDWEKTRFTTKKFGIV